MKFKKSLLRLPLLFALATSQAFASYYIPDSGVTTAKIANSAVTRAKLASGAKAKVLYVTAAADTSVDSTLTDVLEMTCTAACTVTLPTAVGIQGYEVTIIHNGTQLVPITLHTTSSQTIGGIADNTYKLYTVNERITLYSDNVNWKIRLHQASTDWISAGNFMDFFTFTITSGSATLAATYVPAWVFTVTSANATVASTYTNSGVTCTTAATIAAQTTLVMTCPGTPAASGTLTKTAGTGDATITYSAKAGNPSNLATFTVAKTVASGVSLVVDSITDGQNASGRLVKTAGTGDAVIVYSSFTGAKNTTNTTNGATRGIYYGSPTSNSWRWRRNGHFVTFEFKWYQTSAGPVAGTNDMIIALPVVFTPTIDTTQAPVFNTGTGGLTYTSASHDAVTYGYAHGTASINATVSCVNPLVSPYSTTQVRVWCDYASGDRFQPLGASPNPGTSGINNMNFQFELPITGFQPL